MGLSRRDFLGLAGAAALAGCAPTRDLFYDARDAVTGLSMPELPRFGEIDGPFSFAALGDFHIASARGTAYVNRAVADINARDDVAFALVLGDLAAEGRLQEIKLAQLSLSRLTVPYFTVPGEADAAPHDPADLSNYTRLFGEPHWLHESRNWTFIGLDTASGGGAVGDEQLEWLQARLGKVKQSRPVALCTHHPLTPGAADRMANADLVLGMFAEHRLQVAIAGHYHGTAAETHDGVLFTDVPCAAAAPDHHGDTTVRGYRLFHVGADHAVETELVEVTV